MQPRVLGARSRSDRRSTPSAAPPPALPANDDGAPPPAGYDPADYRWVPVRRRPRRDGWTEEKQRRFIEVLADTGLVSAARRVGMTRESAYRLRDKPGAESFAAAWDFILAQRAEARSRMSTHELLWHRLFYGKLKPVMRGGRHVGTLYSPDNDAVLRLYRRELTQRRIERRLAKGHR